MCQVDCKLEPGQIAYASPIFIKTGQSLHICHSDWITRYLTESTSDGSAEVGIGDIHRLCRCRQRD